MSDALWCCYLFPTEKEPEGDPEKPCGEDAEWVIWDGIEPAYDHEVHGCTRHVGELLTDSKEIHQVYPVAWLPKLTPDALSSGFSEEVA